MPAGRPTKYKPEFAELARRLCLLGLTDIQLAQFFGIAESNLNTWKKQYPEFQESLKGGKIIADAEVAEALYQKAVKGDFLSSAYWLNNRGRIYGWSAKQNIEVKATHEVTVTFTPSEGCEPLTEYKPTPRPEPGSLQPANNSDTFIEAEIIPEATPETAPVLWRKIEPEW